MLIGLMIGFANADTRAMTALILFLIEAMWILFFQPFKHRWKNLYQGATSFTRVFVLVTSALFATDQISEAVATALQFIGNMLASLVSILAQIEALGGMCCTSIGFLPCCNLDVITKTLGNLASTVTDLSRHIASTIADSSRQQAMGPGDADSSALGDAVVMHAADDATLAAQRRGEMYRKEQLGEEGAKQMSLQKHNDSYPTAPDPAPDAPVLAPPALVTSMSPPPPALLSFPAPLASSSAVAADQDEGARRHSLMRHERAEDSQSVPSVRSEPWGTVDEMFFQSFYSTPPRITPRAKAPAKASHATPMASGGTMEADVVFSPSTAGETSLTPVPDHHTYRQVFRT